MLQAKKIVKRRKSRSEHCVFTKKKLSKKSMYTRSMYTKILIASHGARVRGSVFKMEFRVFSREFASIETSPGFAQLLGENWV